MSVYPTEGKNKNTDGPAYDRVRGGILVWETGVPDERLRKKNQERFASLGN